MPKLPAEAYAIIEGRHADPFHYLGLHPEGGKSVVRAFLPEASNVEAVGEHGEVARLDRVHDAGLFVGALPNGSKHYQLRAKFGDSIVEFEDAYRFPPILTDFDLYLLGEGTHQRLYDKLGAHPMTLDGVDGIGFVVLAPNARRVSVVGDFNFWDSRRHPMRVRGSGYWGIVHPTRQAGRSLQVRHRRAARPSAAAEIRSDGVRERGASEDGLHRVRRGAPAAAAPGA
ncbi:1,4-alpha-glucan branching enzyme [Bradyrhizobium japonicum]